MIVKIQRSQPPSPKGKVLIYTKEMERWWEGNIDPMLDKWMGEDQKIFAYAHIEDSEMIIDQVAPWQEW